jgi:hypothetical protein
LLSGAERIAQFLDRTLRPVPLYAVPVAAGPNRVLEALQRHTAIRPGVRVAGNVGADLKSFFAQLVTGLSEPGYSWERTATEPPGGVAVWDQLARYWAFGEAMSAYLAGAGDQTDLAARYQLVTPFSGAVVLETAGQFAQAGLKPIDGATAAAVPVIPEPSTTALLLAAALALATRRNRRPNRR